MSDLGAKSKNGNLRLEMSWLRERMGANIGIAVTVKKSKLAMKSWVEVFPEPTLVTLWNVIYASVFISVSQSFC